MTMPAPDQHVFRDVEALIANRFTAVLMNWLTPQEWAEMKRLNSTDPRYATTACASHDYCDANMAMQEAFESVMGCIMDGDNEVFCRIWNNAWERARRYSLNPLGYQAFSQGTMPV